MRLRGAVLALGLSTGCIAEVDILGGDTVGTFYASNGTKNASGFGDTFFSGGPLDPNNEFFASLGTNDRSCGSCHVKEEGWTITPAGVRARFDATGGLHSVFRTNDGSHSPNANVSTVGAREAAYNMLLNKGLIRVGLPIPANAEFTLHQVDDPYGFASANELSLFRRPLPTTNMAFLATVMWDGRETHSVTNMVSNFRTQAASATFGHAIATGIDTSQMNSIVDFEIPLFTAQTKDNGAGDLDRHGATGGPQNLANEPFWIGINDTFDPNFNPNAMTLFNGWASGPPQRQAIFRGQQIFNTRPIAIRGVKGLNDVLGVDTIMGTCTSCHNTPNVGNHSSSLPIDIGIAAPERRTPDMPLYTLRNKQTGTLIQTTDPGRALITGKWADIGKFKGPILRGLQLRPPFFHNGMAASLQDVIDFYNSRFDMSLSGAEQADLLAFLQAL